MTEQILNVTSSDADDQIENQLNAGRGGREEANRLEPAILFLTSNHTVGFSHSDLFVVRSDAGRHICLFSTTKLSCNFFANRMPSIDLDEILEDVGLLGLEEAVELRLEVLDPGGRHVVELALRGGVQDRRLLLDR